MQFAPWHGVPVAGCRGPGWTPFFGGNGDQMDFMITGSLVSVGITENKMG